MDSVVRTQARTRKRRKETKRSAQSPCRAAAADRVICSSKGAASFSLAAERRTDRGGRADDVIVI